MDEKRLDRIEQKIDDLALAVIAIVRVEEKIIASNHRVNALEVRLQRSEADLQAIAIMSRKNTLIMAFANTAFWLVAGGAIAYFIKGK
jgi:hypothetical protein